MMSLDSCSYILFNKPYDELNIRQAEEVYYFREMQEEMRQEEMIASEEISEEWLNGNSAP